MFLVGTYLSLRRAKLGQNFVSSRIAPELALTRGTVRWQTALLNSEADILVKILIYANFFPMSANAPFHHITTYVTKRCDRAAKPGVSVFGGKAVPRLYFG